jgi:CheY-like chemotaxis protein
MDIMMHRSNGVDVAVELHRRFKQAVGASRRASITLTETLGDARAATIRTNLDRQRMPPLVAMTGNTSLANVETYKNVGFRHVLPKPFDIAAMLSTLEACVPPGPR